MKKILIALFMILLCLGLVSCSRPSFIENELADGVHGLYFEAQAEEDAPGILLLMGGSGYNDVYSGIAETLAAHGYHVLIADHYGGGDDWGGAGIDSEEDIAGYSRNAEAGLTYLLSRDGIAADRIGILGFSYGNVLGFNLAYSHPEIKAMVDMYGYMEMGLKDDIPESDFISRLPPTCIIHGDKDKTVKLDRAEKIASLLDQYGIEHEFHVLPDAGHAFIYGEENIPVKDEAMEIATDFLDSYLRQPVNAPGSPDIP